MTKEALEKILNAHAKWLRGEEGGERADLRGADLRGADLRWADLFGADLRGADLRWADLFGADLRWADLRWADLFGADLRGANLREANLFETNLRWADLRWANLRGAVLDFSAWPLRCGSFFVKADKRLFAQLLKHVVMLDVFECEEEVRQAMTVLRQMPCAAWFDAYHSDVPPTPKE